MYVTKRDGTLEDFNLTKTRKVIEWACEGLSINPLILESYIDITFKDKIKTEDIQENLITQALSLVDILNYDWLRVAANLRIMTKYKIYREINYFDFAVKKKYNHILTNYSEKQLLIANSWIDKERDKLYDYAGASILLKKFLDNDEPLQYLYLSNALTIACGDFDFAKELYDSFSLKKISLASPQLSGLRNNGNLASCFIGSIDDSISGIFNSLHNMAIISKNGGGLGIYLGDLRCNGSFIQNKKKAAGGVIPWIKLINDVAVGVNQLGSRNGAITVALPIWHYDIEEFLSLQTEHGDPRKKCFDIQPQIVLSDEFLSRVENNEKFYCFDPHEVKTILGLDFSETKNYNTIVNSRDKLEIVKEYRASDLLKQLLKVVVETGLPYLTYIDEINRRNPNKHSGSIKCVNLCTESFSNTEYESWHTCSLSSLNLANIEKDELQNYCAIITKMLDNILDLCKYPIKESQYHVNNYRTIGIGVMGLADYFVKNGHTYESAYNSKFISDTFEQICYYSIKESIKLAKQRGKYLKFENSEWDNGRQIQNYLNNSNIFKEQWNELQIEINKYGIRNSQLVSPAPNTTSSLIQGCVAGILPPYNLMHYDDSSNGLIAIMPPFISSHILKYKAYHNYDMINMVKYIGEMQKWVDTGISFESLMDLRKYEGNNKKVITAKYLKEFILASWKSGIKANYYWRFITEENSSVSKDDSCISCSG